MHPSHQKSMKFSNSFEDLALPGGSSLGDTKATVDSKYRIPKKFKWSGSLCAKTSKDSVEQLCDVTLSDPSDPLHQSSARLSEFLDPEAPQASLTLTKMYSLSKLGLVLPLYYIDQYARVTSQDLSDADTLTSVAKYMAHRQLVSRCRLFFLILTGECLVHVCLSVPG